MSSNAKWYLLTISTFLAVMVVFTLLFHVYHCWPELNP